MPTIPIFIIVHNQYEILKRAVTSYQQQIATPHEVIFHDVASTYYETLEYLKDMKAKGHRVYRSERNHHHTVVASIRSYLAENPSCEYVVMTDPDIELYNVNPNILDVYIHALNALNKTSVGPMLEIADIPNHYPHKARATLSHRQQFWNKPRKTLDYKGTKLSYIDCMTDTTFQLFRARRMPASFPHSNSIRFFAPYSAKHLDWYLNPHAITPCQLYYHLNTTNISHWNKSGGSTVFKDKRTLPLYYYNSLQEDGVFNFGDYITPFIYHRLFQTMPMYDPTGGRSSKEVLFGCGSILGKSTPSAIIWGSGFIKASETIESPKHILSVRGPLTRERLEQQGIECPECYGDIGLVLPYFYFPKVNKKYKLGIIPHYLEREEFSKVGLQDGGDVKIIDVRKPVAEVVRDILECNVTMSSSLHGIIVSHAYNIKCMWIKITDKTTEGTFEFRDYYGSLGMDNFRNTNPVLYEKPININTAVAMVNDYPNPSFPIKTKHILKLCPFINIVNTD
jgi:pyruvyltransferase